MRGSPASIQIIAELLDITERHARRLVKDGVLPKPIDRKYDSVESVHKYIRYLRKMISGGGELTIPQERARLLKYQADLAANQLKKEDEELVSIKAVIEQWGRILTAVKQGFLAMPMKLAPLIIGSNSIPEVKKILDQGVREVLNELYETEFYTSKRGKIIRKDTATIDNKPVGRQRKKAKPGEQRRTGTMAHDQS